MNLSIEIIYNRWKFYTIILLGCICLGLLPSCKKNCPDSLEAFNDKINALVKDINNRKRLKTDNNWDIIDKKFRNAVFECYPKFSAQRSQSEAIYFWENALGYAFVRYGADLLKKYGKTDRLLLMIGENLNSRKIAIKPAVKRLCREWPVLHGSSEEAIADLLKDIFEDAEKKPAE
jgi:hypothetical protein